jgi:hypothetical protein
MIVSRNSALTASSAFISSAKAEGTNAQTTTSAVQPSKERVSACRAMMKSALGRDGDGKSKRDNPISGPQAAT